MRSLRARPPRDEMAEDSSCILYKCVENMQASRVLDYPPWLIWLVYRLMVESNDMSWRLTVMSEHIKLGRTEDE